MGYRLRSSMLPNINRQPTHPMLTRHPLTIYHQMRPMPQKSPKHHRQPGLLHDHCIIESPELHTLHDFGNVIEIHVRALCYPGLDLHPIVIPPVTCIEVGLRLAVVVDGVCEVRIHEVGVAEGLVADFWPRCWRNRAVTGLGILVIVGCMYVGEMARIEAIEVICRCIVTCV